MIIFGNNFDLKYVESKVDKNAECIFANGKKRTHCSGIVKKIKNTLSLHIDESFYDWYIIWYDYNKSEFNPNLYGKLYLLKNKCDGTC